MELVSAKKVMNKEKQSWRKTGQKENKDLQLIVGLQAGEDRTAPSPAPKEPGVQDAMPRVTVPTEQNATLQMDPAPARLAGKGRAVTNRARWVSGDTGRSYI